MLQCSCVILSSIALILLAGITAWPRDIDLKPNVTGSFTSDIVGPVKQEFDVMLPVDAAFSVGSVTIDLDGHANTVSSVTRLDTLSSFHAEVNYLTAATLKDDLNQSLSQADAAIDVIKNTSSGMSIEELYDQMKVIEKALDDNFIDLVDTSADISQIGKARLLVIAKPIEQRYDYLKYIASKIKGYARDEVKNEFACLLSRTVVALADGDVAGYQHDLSEIISHAAEYRGTMIKQEEADRIRYKADLLLRKIAESGTSRSCDIDLSTTIGDVDIDGGLTWNEAGYRSPSKDVRTDGLDLTASYTNDDWDISIDYQQEWRDYADRLKDDNDRLKHSLDVSISRDLDPYSVGLSLSLEHEFYPNDVDEEIELDRVTEASARSHALVDRVLWLHLPATLEAKLVKDVGEEGALAALVIGDRSQTVDCLDDFIGHVLDAKWDGDIDPVAAQVLIAMASAILPRRRINNINVPLSIGFPFRGGDATVDLEWESKTYPADSVLDHGTSTGVLSYIKEESSFTLSGYLKREELLYPNDTTKSRSLKEWEGSFDKEISCGSIGMTLFQQLAAYPLVSQKNQSVRKLDLDLSIDLSGVSVALQWADKLSEHPNDAEKPIVQVIELGFDANWEVTQGIFSISLSNEQEWNADHADISLLERTLVKETGKAELSWDSKITDDLTVKLSSTGKSVINLADPCKDSTDIILQAEIDLAI